MGAKNPVSLTDLETNGHYPVHPQHPFPCKINFLIIICCDLSAAWCVAADAFFTYPMLSVPSLEQGPYFLPCYSCDSQLAHSREEYSFTLSPTFAECNDDVSAAVH